MYAVKKSSNVPGQGARHRHSSRVLIQVGWIERYKQVEKHSSDVYWSDAPQR